jgi:uncharacterized membrane protein YhhN
MHRWWGFIPYAVVGVIHLGALFTGADALSSATKWLLMPLLLAALLIGLPRLRSEIALWGGLGVLFSWAGDVLLSSPGDTGFVIGLGGFLVAHALYLVLFLRPLRTRTPPPLALFYIAWWVALILILAPHLGGLLIPVAIYGLVLGTAAAFALGTNPITAVGGLIFAISDTVLAFKLFLPDFSLWQADFLIMLFYIVGQGLIIAGAVRHAQGAIHREKVVPARADTVV